MIGKDGLENQKKINEELSATDKAILEAGRKAAQLTEESRSLTAELKDQLGIRSKNNEGEKTLLSLSRQITKSAQENKVSLRESGDITKQLKTDTKTLEAAKREQLILEQTIGKEGIDQAKAISSRAKAIQTSSANILGIENEIANTKGGATEEQLKQLAEQKKGLRLNEAGLSSALKGASADAQRLALANGLVTAAQENVDEGEKQEAAQKRINKSLGIAGGLAKAFKGAFGGLAQTIGMDEVAKDMEKFATEAEDAGKSVSRLQVLGVGMVSAFKGLGNTLTDPSVILSSLIKGFNKVDKAATDFQQQTGQDMNTMSTSLAQFNGGLVTSAELIAAASDVTKEFGINAAAAFDMENIGEIASMKKEMGLAGKEAANLARLSKVNGGNIEAQNKAIVNGINAGNRQNRTAVAHGQVLRDVANVSEGIAVSYAGFPDKLAEAATAARGLGMNLEQVDKIAGSLLQFESSIASEMEAELLTGRSLNLEKARELALNNDLAGVAKELASQGITSANFSQMNRIQQEAQAKALGMSRDEMARMLLSQEMQNGLSEDALNDAQKATLEDLKRVEAQEKFSTAIGKLQQALAPIVGFFADILSNSFVIYSIMGVALVSKIPALVKGFSSFKDNLKGGFDAIKGIVGKTKNLIGGGKAAGEAISSKVPKGLGKGAKSIADSADKTKGIDPKQGSGIKKFLKGLGDGLASIGQQAGNVFKGGLALGGALLAMGVGFALSLPLIAGSDPVLMLAFAGSLSAIGLTVALMGKVGGDIIKGALAMGIMAIALIPAAYAFSLLAGVDAASILAFSIAIPILGLSVMALGLIFTNPITMFLFGAGILGLLALGVAITPLAAAFGKLGDADIAGTMSGISQLASIAPGLSVAASGLYDLAGGLTAVGVAGVLALPVLATLMSAGLIGGGAAGGEDKKEGGMEKVNKNLEKLIALVEAGGDVIIDGVKVGKTLQLSSSTMG